MSGESSKKGSEESRETGRFHYTKVFHAGLRLGYTRRDLADMPYGELIFDLAAMNDADESKHEKDTAASVKDATQEDIRTILD